MKQNELILDDNQSGFLSNEQEPINFLSVDHVERLYMNDLVPKRNDTDFKFPYIQA